MTEIVVKNKSDKYYGFLIITDRISKSNTFTFENKYATIYEVLTTDTPIAQGIEHRPPEAGAAVRIRLGVFLF